MVDYGIVFSGGGALGAWEVGCYDAIKGKHRGDPPIVVTGASAGAINAVGVCAGIPAQRLGEIWAAIEQKDVCRFRFTKWDALHVLGKSMLVGLPEALRELLSRYKSLYDTTPLKDTLRHHLKGYYNDFARSQVRFGISVTNLVNQRKEYFYKVPGVLPGRARENNDAYWEQVNGLEHLLDALIGSTALPVLFPPQGQYFDGGVLLNQPITPAILLNERENEPKILYVIIPSAAGLGRTDNVVQTGETVLSVWTSASLISQLERIRLVNRMRGDRGAEGSRIAVCVIRPPQDLTTQFGVDLLSFGKKVSELVEDGRNAAHEKLNRFSVDDDTTWFDVA